MKKKIYLVAGLCIALSTLFTACNKSEDNTTRKTKFGIPVSDEVISFNTVPLVQSEIKNRLKSYAVFRDTTVVFHKKKIHAVITYSTEFPYYDPLIWMFPAGVPKDLLNTKSTDITINRYYSYNEATSFTEDGWRIPTFTEANNALGTELKYEGKNFPDVFDISNTTAYGVLLLPQKIICNSNEYYYWVRDNLGRNKGIYQNAIHTPISDIDNTGYDLGEIDTTHYKASIMLVKKL